MRVLTGIAIVVVATTESTDEGFAIKMNAKRYFLNMQNKEKEDELKAPK
jgi:hypothetical protein